jgi:hypothetical protein
MKYIVFVGIAFGVFVFAIRPASAVLAYTVSAFMDEGWTPIAGSVSGDSGGLFLQQGNAILMCSIKSDGTSHCIMVK